MSWNARLRARLKTLGWSVRELERRSGVPYENLAKYVQGRIKQPRGDTLDRIATTLGLDERTLLYGDEPWPTRVPIIGYAGGGERWIAAEADADHPDTIAIEVDDDDPVAIQVRGDSMSPVYRDRDVLVGYRGRGIDPRAAIGHDCIIETAGRDRYVKILQKGGSAGHYRLRSYNPAYPDIEDVVITWVAPIAIIKRNRL